MPRLAFVFCLLAALTAAAEPLTLTPRVEQQPEQEHEDRPRTRMYFAYAKMIGGTVIATGGGVAFGLAAHFALQTRPPFSNNDALVASLCVAGSAVLIFAAGMIGVGLSRLMNAWDFARREEVTTK